MHRRHASAPEGSKPNKFERALLKRACGVLLRTAELLLLLFIHKILFARLRLCPRVSRETRCCSLKSTVDPLN